jgi:hypothetical protein
MVHGIRADELPRLTPKLNPYLRRPDPAWPDSSMPPTGCDTTSGYRNRYGAMLVWPWAANWRRSHSRSSRPRR